MPYAGHKPLSLSLSAPLLGYFQPSEKQPGFYDSDTTTVASDGVHIFHPEIINQLRMTDFMLIPCPASHKQLINIYIFERPGKTN